MSDDNESLQPLSDSQRETLEEATTQYTAAISAREARWFLSRGLSKETARTFRLGVVRDAFPGHERYEGWVAIPYLDHAGNPKSMRFRCIEEHDHREYGHGKYLSMPDEPARLFNTGAIVRADETIHVTEGEFDAMILEQCNLHAVAVPGAQSWRSYFRRMLAGFNRVYVWGDPDDAGADFSRKLTRAMRQAKGVRLRSGDVSDTYCEGGKAAILALIERESE